MPSKPYMPLYVAEFLADTMTLTAAELGVYVRLLLWQWSNDRHIPAPMLKKIGLITSAEWHQIAPELEPYFQVDEHGCWYNRRVEKELQEFHGKQMARSKAGREAANRRWKGRKND